MTWQLLLTLIGASVGALSGAWLCYPTANANPHALAWAADPPYKSAEGFSQLAIEQSAQYWVGGLLLILTFLFQVAAALVPAESLAVASLGGAKVLVAAAGAVLSALLCVGLLSMAAYRWRIRRLEVALRAASEYLAANRRLTPRP
jgi:hypothetical protein